jgi:hypothetical protein
MASNFDVEGRQYRWAGYGRLAYVRKAFPLLWVDAPQETATHVIHFWLPTTDAPFNATIRKVDQS